MEDTCCMQQKSNSLISTPRLARVLGTGRYQPLLLFSFFSFSFPYNSPSRYRLVELELEFFSPKFVVIVVVVVPTYQVLRATYLHKSTWYSRCS